MSTNRKKLLVIAGAGASSDNYSGIGPKQTEWALPLTVELFGTPKEPGDGPNKEFQRILKQYPGALIIANALALPHRRRAASIEEELSIYARTPGTLPQFMHVPPYLREMLANCSERSASSPGNYQSLIYRLLNVGQYDVCVLTTNYDTLIERNVASIPNLGFCHDSLDSDISSTPHFMLVKLHGSVDWFKTHSEIQQEATESGWFNAIETGGLQALGTDIFY